MAIQRIRFHAALVRRIAQAALVVPCWSGLFTAYGGPSSAIMVGNFSGNDLTGWESHFFSGETRYELVNDAQTRVIRAVARGTASGIVREFRVDLTSTPVLRWRWRVDGTLKVENERTKSDDDFAARLYVIRKSGIFFWKTQTVNYVWSNHQSPGTSWSNPYTANSQMIAVRSGNQQAGVWFSERRNVREDFKRLFDTDVTTIHAIAIMTDADNTKQNASAWYGDIQFTAN